MLLYSLPVSFQVVPPSSPNMHTACPFYDDQSSESVMVGFQALEATYFRVRMVLTVLHVSQPPRSTQMAISEEMREGLKFLLFL